MLVLSRRAGERIQIGEQIEVTVVRIGPGIVRIGIEAPAEMTVVREEIRSGFVHTVRDGRTKQTDLAANKIESE
jgi:carbon storage regulator